MSCLGLFTIIKIGCSYWDLFVRVDWIVCRGGGGRYWYLDLARCLLAASSVTRDRQPNHSVCRIRAKLQAVMRPYSDPVTGPCWADHARLHMTYRSTGTSRSRPLFRPCVYFFLLGRLRTQVVLRTLGATRGKSIPMACDVSLILVGFHPIQEKTRMGFGLDASAQPLSAYNQREREKKREKGRRSCIAEAAPQDMTASEPVAPHTHMHEIHTVIAEVKHLIAGDSSVASTGRCQVPSPMATRGDCRALWANRHEAASAIHGPAMHLGCQGWMERTPSVDECRGLLDHRRPPAA